MLCEDTACKHFFDEDAECQQELETCTPEDACIEMKLQGDA